MHMNFLLVFRGVFSHVVKPGIQVMSFLEHLANFNCDSRGRAIHNVQVSIFLENQRVGQCIDVIGIPIS